MRKKWEHGPLPDPYPDDELGERLNSPVTDGGIWPYDDLAQGFQDTLTSLSTPRDPLGFCPKEK